MTASKFIFTRKSLMDIQPQEKRQAYSDQETRGLILDVTPAGVKTFRIYRKVQGKPERITLGRFNPLLPESREFPQGTDILKAMLTRPELNVRMARRMAEAVNVQLDAGNNIAETKRAARGELTLGQLFEKYYQEHVIPYERRTGDGMRQLFEIYLGEMPDYPVKKHGVKRKKSEIGVNWQHRKISSIRPDEVRRLHLAVGAIRSPSTANHIVDLLKAMYRKAAEWGDFTGQIPTATCSLLKEVSRDRFLKADELPRFWKALDEEPDQRYKDFVLISVLTGARSGNTVSMRWDNLDLEAAEWKIPDEVSKNGSAIRVVLVPEALAILKRRKTASDAHPIWVFPGNTAAGHMAPQRKRWAALLKRAEITDLRFHDLRRSLGSWQARTGASLLIIGKSLGHKSQQATQIYARLDTDPIRESVIRAATAMRNAGRVEPAQEAPEKKVG